MNMKIHRLAPLPLERIRQKQEYYDHFRRRDFNKYRSPWIPMTADNIATIRAYLEKHGGIVVNAFGIEVPVPEGRDITYGGSIQMDTQMRANLFGEGSEKLSFAWIDGRDHDTEELAGCMHEQYITYSECVGNFLSLLENNLQSIGPVQFPLYHAARDAFGIQLKGCFDCDVISRTRIDSFGFPMLAATGRLEAWKLKQPGPEKEKSGGMIKISAFDGGNPPVWLRLNDLSIANSEAGVELFMFLASSNTMSFRFGPNANYTWQMVLKEMFPQEKPISTLLHSGITYIFEPEPFCNYKPDGVVER